MDKFIRHIGVPRRSGRYPWGSGKHPQHSTDLLGNVDDLKKEGLNELDIAKGLGMKTTQLRTMKSIAKAQKRAADSSQALMLKDKGLILLSVKKCILMSPLLDHS